MGITCVVNCHEACAKHISALPFAFHLRHGSRENNNNFFTKLFDDKLTFETLYNCSFHVNNNFMLGIIFRNNPRII